MEIANRVHSVIDKLQSFGHDGEGMASGIFSTVKDRLLDSNALESIQSLVGETLHEVPGTEGLADFVENDVGSAVKTFRAVENIQDEYKERIPALKPVVDCLAAQFRRDLRTKWTGFQDEFEDLHNDMSRNMPDAFFQNVTEVRDFATEDVAGKGEDSLLTKLKNLILNIPKLLTEGFKHIWDAVKNMKESIQNCNWKKFVDVDNIASSFQNISKAFKTFLSDFKEHLHVFDKCVEFIQNLFSKLVNLLKRITDGVVDLFQQCIQKVVEFAASSEKRLAGMFDLPPDLSCILQKPDPVQKIQDQMNSLFGKFDIKGFGEKFIAFFKKLQDLIQHSIFQQKALTDASDELENARSIVREHESKLDPVSDEVEEVDEKVTNVRETLKAGKDTTDAFNDGVDAFKDGDVNGIIDAAGDLLGGLDKIKHGFGGLLG